MWIMIAGPYRTGASSDSEREKNRLALNRAALAVFRKGHVPIVGVNLALPLIELAGADADAYDEVMMPLSLELASRCDAILRLEGASRGADEEVERVRARGGAIYHALKDIPTVSKEEFYRGKTVEKVLWYLADPSEPGELAWARLRVFDDGSADSTFSVEGPAFGFVEERYAGYILNEDEYYRFDKLDEEDEAELGLRLADITPPTWVDPPDKPFEFLGRR